MGVVPAPLVVFWTLVGAAVGALVAALVARNQFVGVRREHRLQVKRRDAALERLKKEVEEHRSDYSRRSEEYLRELASLKRERTSLAADLEETRRTLTTLQSNLETLRASAREAESRLATALDSARQDAAARRATAAEELSALAQSAQRTRTELSRRIADLENDRSRLETELAAERRANAEKQESLRSILTTLREQYSLASSERDALSREVEEERTRANEAEAEARRTREEYSKRIDAEHQESMELISRVWDYVHHYIRGRPADLPPEAESPSPQVPESEGRARSSERARAAPEEQQGAREPLTTDREVETPHARTLGDRCPVDDYDIERALAETPAPAPESAPAPAPSPAPSPARPAAPATPTAPSGAPPERGWRSVPPLSSGSTRVRKPVSAMRRGEDVLVICDDGSVWLRRPTGWVEEPPIPGSPVNHEKGSPPGDVTSGGSPG